jgi:rhomboid protease GluP
VPSAGASGAIFGVIGADVAFFLVNRRSMGSLGQRQLLNLVILIAINVVIGLTPGAGINNYAHMGGLVSGVALGMGLAPRYAVDWNAGLPRLINRQRVSMQALVVVAVVVLLFAGVYLGNIRWLPYLPQLGG